MKPDMDVAEGRKVCPQAELHTEYDGPYAGFTPWAVQKAKTHRVSQCPGCGLWRVWTPKEPE